MYILDQGQSIKLGDTLEAIIVPILEEEHMCFTRSPKYETLMTRPDFLISENGINIASLAVTATSSTQSWMRKRWRYIDEVFQLKSYYGPDFLIINVIYSDVSAFQNSEIIITNALFDATINANEIDGGREIVDYASRQIIDYPNSTALEIAQNIIELPIWKQHSDAFIEELKLLLHKRDDLTKEHLFHSIWIKEHETFSSHLSSIIDQQFNPINTYLRYTVLNCLLVGPDKVNELCSCVNEQKTIPQELLELCENTDFQIIKRINGMYFDDDRLKNTIKAGFNSAVYSAIEANMFNNDTQRYLLRDIQDNAIIVSMVEKTLPSICNEHDISTILQASFKSSCYLGIQHVRVWPLDVIAAYINTSIAYINKLYTTQYGRIGVSNPVNNFVMKTSFAINRFASDIELMSFCNNLGELLFRLISQLEIHPCQNEVVSRLKNNKRSALKLQPYLNPVQRYVESVLQNNGFKYTKNPVSCILGVIDGLPGRMKKIEEIYQVDNGRVRLWIKCIAGYDGVKDKTREMAARAQLLKYETPDSEKRTIPMIFVCDGQWDQNLQKLLALSGWKQIVPIFELDAFLRAL